MENPLVSIIVITYNSSKYVLETLESAKAQTYQNIELIISDDASKDDTVEICQKWVEENKERFVRTEIITVPENSGIPANCNRGVKASQGEWVKLIAGDDVIINNAIETLLEQIRNENQSIEIVDSQVLIFNSDLSQEIGKFDFGNSEFYKDKISANEQLKILINNLNRTRIISTLGVFLRRQLIKKVGGYDENYRLLEDTPFWFRVLKSNTKFYYIGIPTVIYRRHENAVSFNNKKNKIKIIPDFNVTVENFFWEKAYAECSFIDKLNMVWNRGITKFVLLLGNKGLFAKTVFMLGLKLQPIRFYNLVNKLKF